MRNFVVLTTLATLAAGEVNAEEPRGLGAHEHGVGSFNIAMEGAEVAMELEAPGKDIVGFEHAAASEEDRAAIAAGKTLLGDPLSLFILPAGAGCTVAAAEVELVGEHEEHIDGHDEEHADGEVHEEHAGHEDEGADEGHTEFRAEYRLSCADPSALSRIEFAYFDTFPNAEELEVQMIGADGSRGFEVTRDDPVLEIPGSS